MFVSFRARVRKSDTETRLNERRVFFSFCVHVCVRRDSRHRSPACARAAQGGDPSDNPTRRGPLNPLRNDTALHPVAVRRRRIRRRPAGKAVTRICNMGYAGAYRMDYGAWPGVSLPLAGKAAGRVRYLTAAVPTYRVRLYGGVQNTVFTPSYSTAQYRVPRRRGSRGR